MPFRVRAHVKRCVKEGCILDWLKQNREKLLVGAAVVIAGVAFVVVATGSGGLILAPALLFASHDAPSAPQLVVSQP
jgi:hypothetical protein